MNEYINREIIDNTRNKKDAIKNYIKKLIIYFFIIMLVLTFVSRAADSVLVAKVTLTKAKPGELTFEFKGNGKITGNTKHYIDIYEGIQISKVLVTEGAKVKEGDPLFRYNTKDLESKYKEAENNILKVQLNYEKAKLSNENTSEGTSAKEAELALQRAQLDLTLAKQRLQISKDKTMKEIKDECEKLKKEYEDALATYNEQELQMKSAVEKANRQLQKALDARAELDEERKEAETVLDKYRLTVEGLTENAEDVISSINGKKESTNQSYFSYLIYDIENKFITILNSLDSYSDAMAYLEQNDQQITGSNVSPVKQSERNEIVKAAENIFKYYYGEEKYKEHKKEVEEAEKKLRRVKEDYVLSLAVTEENGGNLTTGEKLSYIRQYEDAYSAFKNLTADDNELINAIEDYGYALIKKDTMEIKNTYSALFSLIYKEDKEKTRKIKEADEQIEIAGQDYDDVKAEWTGKTSEAKKQAEDLRIAYEEKKAIYDQMLNGTYDYTEDVWDEERQVESALRTVEDAEIDVEKAKENDKQTAKKKQNDKEIEEIDYKLYEMELEEKKEIADKFEELLKLGGEVTSPVSGYVTDIGVVEGNITTGSEKLAIAVEGCSVQIFVTKEEAKRIETGDEMVIKIGDNNEIITVPVTGIGKSDDDGKVEITGTMPEGEYPIGADITYELKKTSKQYPMTIPVTALHSDGKGNYYVLVPEENNTVLGYELIARKIAVTLIDKSDTEAAVNGSLYSVNIISGSNKNIEEGDRVRCVEEY